MEALVAYYINLLIIQYHSRPRAKGTIRAFITELIELYSFFKEIESAYTLDNAIGDQLDTAGLYFGALRNFVGINFQYEYFVFQYIGGNDEGLTFQTLQNKDVGKVMTLIPEDTYEYSLDDNQFRTFIKMRAIGLHNSEISYAYLYNLMFELLGSSLYIEIKSDMSIDFYFSDVNLKDVFATYKNMLPAPTGVETNVFAMRGFLVKFCLRVTSNNGGTVLTHYQWGFQNITNKYSGAWKTIN